VGYLFLDEDFESGENGEICENERDFIPQTHPLTHTLRTHPLT
jgi:hypothetical protein